MEKIKNLFVPAHMLVILAATAFFFTGSFLFAYNPLLPLFAGACLLVLSLFYRAPLYLLAFLIVVRMSLDYSSQYLTLTLYEIPFTLSQLIGLGIAFLGALLLFQYQKQFFRYPLWWPVALVLLWGGVSLSFSVAPAATSTELIRVFGLLAIGAMAFLFTRKKKDYALLLGAILVSAILPLLFSLYQFLFGVGFADADVAVVRIFGTFSHPNIFSLYLFALLVVTTLLALFWSHQKPSSSKQPVLLFLFGTFSVFLLLTFTRVAWVTAFLFGSVILFFRSKLAFAAILLFPVALYFASSTFQDRVQESLSPDPDSSIVWRQNLWHDTTLKTVQDEKTLFGFGMNTFPLISERLRGENVGSHDPHNDIVRFFVEGGYIGVAAYFVYIISILFILVRAALLQKKKGWLKNSLWVLVLFWVCLFFAGLSDNIFKNTPVEWIFFILSGSLLKLARKH